MSSNFNNNRYLQDQSQGLQGVQKTVERANNCASSPDSNGIPEAIVENMSGQSLTEKRITFHSRLNRETNAVIKEQSSSTH